MENVAKQAQSSVSKTTENVSKFDRSSQKTQKTLSNWMKQKYQILLEAKDKIPSTISKTKRELSTWLKQKYQLLLEAKDKILKSDGQSQTVVTFKITDANGTPVTDKGVEVAFATSLGKFAEQRVSIQNGEATVIEKSYFPSRSGLRSDYRLSRYHKYFCRF